jgi:hypothetical protein
VNSNTISANASGAVGAGNTVSGAYSLALGSSNGITGVGSLAIGDSNYISGIRSVAIGDFNNVPSQGTLAAGGYNINYGSYSLMVGQNNGAGNAYCSATIGMGLANSWMFSTLVGHYNDNPVNAPLFVVGNGTDNLHRSNAMTVQANGDVNVAGKLRVWRAGDISMGAFKNGPKPDAGVDPDPVP